MLMEYAQHRSSRASASAGFTLVEILVVIVILGIASALIIPQMGGRDDLKTSSAARLLMADLIYAQNRSIARQEMHYIEFDVAANRYELLTELSPRTLLEHPVNKTPYRVTLGPQGLRGMETVQLAEAGFDGQVGLAFDELGTPYFYQPGGDPPEPMDSGRITLSSGSFSLTIRIEPYTGEIKIE